MIDSTDVKEAGGSEHKVVRPNPHTLSLEIENNIN